MKVGLDGKVLVVTGAAQGIGRAIAQLAAGSGAEALLLTDRDAGGLEDAARDIGAVGTAVRCHVADLADEGAPAAIGAAATDAFGRIDGLVNAAGLTTRGSVADATPALWDAMFAVNARAAFFPMQAAIRDMTSRGAPGAIVNVLSMNARCGPPELAVYAATKGALATLTKNAAHAHMGDRVRVNGIDLGWVATPAERRMQARTLGHGEEWHAEAARRQPLGRLVTAEECARLTVFLLSDASAPMSGVLADLEQQVDGAPLPPAA